MPRVVLPPKYVGERKLFSIDFSNLMEESAVIDSASCTIAVYCGVDPLVSQMLVGPVRVTTAQRVAQMIEAGEPGVIYHLTVVAVTDTLEVLTQHAYLAILDPDTDVADPECCTRIGNASSEDGQAFVMTNAARPVDEYRHGLPLYVIFDDEQTVAAPTINVDGLGAKLMILTESVGIQVLEILSDDVLHLVYDEDANAGAGAFVVMNKIQTERALFVQTPQGTFAAGTDKFVYPGMPSMVILGAWGLVKEPSSDGDIIFDLNADGVSMFTDKLTIDEGDNDSYGSASPVTFASRTFFEPWTISGDVDDAGTDAEGYGILIKFRPLT